MTVILRRFIPFLLILVLVSCNNNTTDKKASQEDSMAMSKDSLHTGDSLVYEDCYEKFFKSGTPVGDSNKIILTLKNGSPITLGKFFSGENASKYARSIIKSIDNDTIPELVTYNYTGGAHCCDEITVFAKDKKGYNFKAKLYGGFVCIDPATNLFTYSFNETLGYFFGCYACGFSDSANGFTTLREIQLRYNNGKFELQRYSPEEEKKLLHNLQVLHDHGYEEIQDGMMDNGWRKEFAMNFAVWHYNNGKNWDATKKLFDQYYTFKDAAKVWKEFYATLKDAEKQSTI